MCLDVRKTLYLRWQNQFFRSISIEHYKRDLVTGLNKLKDE